MDNGRHVDNRRHDVDNGRHVDNRRHDVDNGRHVDNRRHDVGAIGMLPVIMARINLDPLDQAAVGHR